MPFRQTRKMITAFSLFFLLFYGYAEAKTIETFLIRIGGNNLRSGDEVHLAKHSIIFCNKFHYDDIGGDTWKAIKNINPKSEIYLYGKVALVDMNSGGTSTLYLNELGRYSVSRGHSMGSLNGSNPWFFLLDESGNRIRWSYNSAPVYWLDFGSSSFHNYSIEAILTDYANRPWTADGVYSDQTFMRRVGMSEWPDKYDTNAKWANAMKSMILATSAGLHARNQKFAGNSGPTYYDDSSGDWIEMDQSSKHPDVLLEEAAFAVKYGNGDIQFYPESKWLYQVNLLRSLKNIKACFNSSCDLSPGQSGIDNYGDSFTFWDAFYYILGSYLIGKNDVHDTAYIQFYHASASYNTSNLYYDEYDKIDLGKALSNYKVTTIGGNNIYWREFEKGYVYVNPTTSNITSINLPESCKRITHSNINTAPENLSNVNSIRLDAHRAAILYKANVSSSPQPTPPSDSAVTIDNGDSGTSSSGTWSYSSALDYYGSNSLYSQDAGATYTFQVNLDGSYDVSMWWTELPSRDPSVQVRVFDGSTAIDTVWVDQTINGGQWNFIGTYDFKGSARIVILSEDGYSTCADAVLFEPLAATEPDYDTTGIVIDNNKFGTSSSGSWSDSTGLNYYGTQSLYSQQAGATYTFQASVTGSHDVSLWWTELPSRSQSVPVRVYDGSTIIDTVRVNQTIDGGQWNFIGTYDFTGSARIVIVSEDGESTCADAVLFKPSSEITELVIDNNNLGTSSNGTWSDSTGPDSYGTRSLYSQQAGATYTFQASATGVYDVSLWWTGLPSRDPSVPVRVYNGSNLVDTVWIDQRTNGGRWNKIGSYNFNGNARIVIESESTSYSTCADAVRLN